MAEKTGEQLSTLMDCECEASELELAVRRLIKDRDLKARWQRYHLIGDALKNNLPEIMDVEFAERIQKAIDADLPIKKPAKISPLSSWYKPLTGFALAASVASIAVFGLRASLVEDTGTIPKQLISAASSPPMVNINDGGFDEEARLRLNNYLVNHSEYASLNGVRGVLPYVHMVGYQTNR